MGDFDSNLLKQLGLNSWFSEEKQRGLASRVPAGLALAECVVFRLLRDCGDAATNRAKMGNRRSRPLASVRLVYR